MSIATNPASPSSWGAWYDRARKLNPKRRRKPSEAFWLAVQRAKYTPEQKAIGFSLARYLSMYLDNGKPCKPSVETLAKDAGTCARTVNHALAEFERWGHLMVYRKRGASNLYDL